MRKNLNNLKSDWQKKDTIAWRNERGNGRKSARSLITERRRRRSSGGLRSRC